jgi:hypothetical protein
MCFGHIDKPKEGLRCYEGGHQRSRRTIGEDGRLAYQLPWLAGHGLWPFAPPPLVVRAGHHQHTKVPLVPEDMKCARFVLFPLIQQSEGAPTGHAYMSHYVVLTLRR